VINQKILEVQLGKRSYPIIIGSSLIQDGFNLEKWITGKDCLIVTNEVIAPLYLDSLLSSIKNKGVHSIVLPDGESNKNQKVWAKILDKLVEMRASRDTTIIALGGGVIGDISGFAAASYMRGISYIQIPTTLLSQVDSSVGGKTGINHPNGKNLIGAFHQPKLVLIDTATLCTLPEREFISGLAEVIKYGAIADEKFFSWLENNVTNLLQREPTALVQAILTSCKTKAEIVGEDELEMGKRALLNFGHTFGHAIENVKGYGEIFHGEAIAIGMLLAADISAIHTDEKARLERLIRNIGLPHTANSIEIDSLLDAMLLDKKVQDKKLRFILLRSLGDAVINNNINNEDIRNVLNKRLN
jgi:3-dehydroquinate synthase